MALRVFREARGLNRKEAAKKAGFHINQLGSWERGEEIPRTDRFAEYLSFLRAPGDVLLNLVRNKTAAPLEGLHAAVKYLLKDEGLSESEIERLKAWREIYGDQAIRDVLADL